MSLPDTYEIQGRNVSLPAVVRDASSGTAMYMVDAGAAQHLVPEAFEVVEAAPGQTQVTLIIVDYRDNDLGDYDGVFLSLAEAQQGLDRMREVVRLLSPGKYTTIGVQMTPGGAERLVGGSEEQVIADLKVV